MVFVTVVVAIEELDGRNDTSVKGVRISLWAGHSTSTEYFRQRGKGNKVFDCKIRIARDLFS